MIDSKFSTVICAPVYSRYDGLSTQFEVGISEGLKAASSIFCDELISIEKLSSPISSGPFLLRKSISWISA